MKKTIYIWLLCLGGLFLSQQSIAQRGHENRGRQDSKSYRKAEKNYRKSQAKSYKHYQKRGRSYDRDNHHVFTRNRGHYDGRPANRHYNNHYNDHYNGRRIARGPQRHYSYRGVPWGPRHHYDYDRHVYFPDYHAFYDARRHGYVYRNRGRWIFSQSVPSFMVGLNWNNVRLQYLQGVPVTTYPQEYYDSYSSRYPAVSFNLNLNL